MHRLPVVPLLRHSLAADAFASLLVGAAMATLATPIAARTGIPAPLLLAAGLFALCYAAVLGALSQRSVLPVAALRVIVFGNLAWAAACLLLAAGVGVEPNLAGSVFLAVQGAAVLLLAELQWFGWRRAATAPICSSDRLGGTAHA